MESGCIVVQWHLRRKKEPRLKMGDADTGKLDLVTQTMLAVIVVDHARQILAEWSVMR